MATLHANWGFGSHKDLEEHHCDMCEACYDKVVTFIDNLGGSVKVRERSVYDLIGR